MNHKRGDTTLKMKKKVYYVVHRGRKTGIYDTWRECQVQVENYEGAQFKKFENEEEANEFLVKGFGNKKTFSKAQSITKKIESKNEQNMEEMLQYDDEKIYIYTDGSRILHNKTFYCGYGFFIPSKGIRVGRPLLNQKNTNNRAELMAILESVKSLNEEDKRKRLCIFTDSQYSIYLFTGTGERYERNQWKNEKNEEVPNIDLIQQLLHLKRNYTIHLLKVRAHTNAQDEHSLANAVADRLANESAREHMERILGTHQENPFRQQMFGEPYTQEEYKRKICEDVESKRVALSPSELFESYDTNKVRETKKKLLEKKANPPPKETPKTLQNSNLMSWFQDS